jgi:hypothetical protein
MANDVHRKNQHQAWTFGQNARRIGLRRSDGRRHVLSAPTLDIAFEELDVRCGGRISG